MTGIRVNRAVVIPESELEFRFSTSSGPGGQHANKAATRVEVSWNVAGTAVLGDRQRDRILRALRNRIDSTGTLRVASERHRSQARNRTDATARLAALVASALRPRTARTPTAPTPASRQRRLAAKRHRGETKARRRRPALDD